MKGILFTAIILLIVLAIYQKFISKKVEGMNFGFSQPE